MADTGPPWNLRFPGPQDFVRETNFYIEDLAEDTAAALSLAGNEGIGPNVVQTVLTSPFALNSTTYDDVPGLSVTITPSSATSRILVVAYVNMSHTVLGARGGYLRIMRGATSLPVGDADGSRTQGAGGSPDFQASAAILSFAPVFLDSPETSDPVTYQVQIRAGTEGSVLINRDGRDANDAISGRVVSTITVIEVAP